MKIYQERMRSISFLHVMSNFNEQEAQQPDAELLKECKLICKKIQLQIERHSEYYQQAHIGQTATASLALSALTNSVSEMTEVWSLANSLTFYCLSMHRFVEEVQLANKKIQETTRFHALLKGCDHDVRVKQVSETSINSQGDQRDILLINDIEADLRKIQLEVGAFMKQN